MKFYELRHILNVGLNQNKIEKIVSSLANILTATLHKIISVSDVPHFVKLPDSPTYRAVPAVKMNWSVLKFIDHFILTRWNFYLRQCMQLNLKGFEMHAVEIKFSNLKIKVSFKQTREFVILKDPIKSGRKLVQDRGITILSTNDQPILI